MTANAELYQSPITEIEEHRVNYSMKPVGYVRSDPLGLHRVKILERDGLRLLVGPLEAIDGTPIVDIKPVLAKSCDS